MQPSTCDPITVSICKTFDGNSENSSTRYIKDFGQRFQRTLSSTNTLHRHTHTHKASTHQSHPLSQTPHVEYGENRSPVSLRRCAYSTSAGASCSRRKVSARSSIAQESLVRSERRAGSQFHSREHSALTDRAAASAVATARDAAEPRSPARVTMRVPKSKSQKSPHSYSPFFSLENQRDLGRISRSASVCTEQQTAPPRRGARRRGRMPASVRAASVASCASQHASAESSLQVRCRRRPEAKW